MTWGNPVQSFVFLGLLVFELEPMYATSDRQTDGRTTDADHRLMPPPLPLRGGGIISGHFNSYKNKIHKTQFLDLCLEVNDKMLAEQEESETYIITITCHIHQRTWPSAPDCLLPLAGWLTIVLAQSRVS